MRKKLVFLILALCGLCALGVFNSPNAKAADPNQPGPWLIFEVGRNQFARQEKPDIYQSGSFIVEIETEGADNPTELYRAQWRAIRGLWLPQAVNLEAYAGQEILLRFLVYTVYGLDDVAYFYWGHPRIVEGPLGESGTGTLVMDLAEKYRLGDSAWAFLGEPDDPGTEREPAGEDNGYTNPAACGFLFQPGFNAFPNGASGSAKPWCVEFELTIPDIAAPLGSFRKPGPQRNTVIDDGRRMAILATESHVYAPFPNGTAGVDLDTMRFDIRSPYKANGQGYAFAGFETQNVTSLTLQAEYDTYSPATNYGGADHNSFAGLVLDYHTEGGYTRRVWLCHPDAFPAEPSLRSERNVPRWQMDPESRTRLQEIEWEEQFHTLPAGNNFSLDLFAYAPSNWDGRLWVGAGLQDVGSEKTLVFTIEDRVAIGAAADGVSQNPIILEDDKVKFVLSGKTGALLEGWDKTTWTQVLTTSFEPYLLDTPQEKWRSTEALDVVEAWREETVEGQPSVVFECHNTGLPQIRLEKRYTLRPNGELSKRIEFQTEDEEGFFVLWNSNTRTPSDFAQQAQPMGELKPYVVWSKYSAGMVADDFSLGVASYRFRVNDRFVLRGMPKGNEPPPPADETSWAIFVFADWVKKDAPVSAEVRWHIFQGDALVHDRHYMSHPEYQNVWTYERPQWTRQVVADAMRTKNETVAFHEKAWPHLVTGTIWHVYPPWGNWWSHSDPPYGSYNEVVNLAATYRSIRPNARVAAYTNMRYQEESNMWADHPEFAVRGKNGQPINYGYLVSGDPAYDFQILRPECWQYVLDMHADRTAGWDLDFHYMDGPGWGFEHVDWSWRDVTQHYDWMELMRDLRARLQQVKPEAALFVNGIQKPYTDFGYIEFRTDEWQKLFSTNRGTWQDLAWELLRIKVNHPPEHIIVPTYGWPIADPTIASYTVFYGWLGHFFYEQRYPWMEYAMHYRRMAVVENAVEPCWWRNPGQDFEALGFTKEGIGIVHVLDHGAATTRTITVSVDTAKLGLIPGEPLYGRLRQMTNAVPELEGEGTNPAGTYANTTAFTEEPFGEWENCPAILNLEIPVDRMHVSTVLLTHHPEKNLAPYQPPASTLMLGWK